MLSTISKKGLTTVPSGVRQALSVKEGDLLRWEIIDTEEGRAARVQPIPDPYAFLKGRRNDPELTYAKAEDTTDALLMQEFKRERRAHRRARSSHRLHK